MKRTAECCCGISRIEVSGEPSINAVCHCRNCQKRTGSAFGISLYFPEENVVSKTKTTQIYKVDAASGPQERHFCSTCGTSLFWRSSQFPKLVGVAGGCFNEDIPEPNISASNESGRGWVNIPETWKLVE